MHDELSCKRFYVRGTVQGVGFRYFVERAAHKRNLAGFVRNLRDGRVEVYAIGPGAQLAELRRELERGPRGAFVESVDQEDAPFESRFSESFAIEYDA